MNDVTCWLLVFLCNYWPARYNAMPVTVPSRTMAVRQCCATLATRWLAVPMAGSRYVMLAVELAGSNDNAIRWLPMAGSAIHGLTLAGSKTMAALSLPQAGRCPAIKMAGDDVRRLILYNKCGLLLPLTPRPAKRPFAARFRFLRGLRLTSGFRTIGLTAFRTARLTLFCTP